MIKYKVVERENAVTRQVLYYAMSVLNTSVGLDEITEAIEKSSTVSSADIKAVLDALQYEIMRNLRAGNSVRLGDVGSFRPTVSSRSAETAEAFLPSNIKGVRVTFTPSSKLRADLALDRVSIQRVVEGPEPGADEEGGL